MLDQVIDNSDGTWVMQVDDWYQWSIDNWGTKWNSWGFCWHDDDNPDVLTFQFTTAWCPPGPIFAALEEKGLEVHVANWTEGGYTDGVEEICGDPWKYLDEAEIKSHFVEHYEEDEEQDS